MQDLADKRIALVLTGGGAKCAYQTGVWRALWEKGIRKFEMISGASGGSLNAILIAGLTPDEARATWKEMIAKGVLEKPPGFRSGIFLFFLGHFLLLFPLVLAAALSGLLFLLPQLPLLWLNLVNLCIFVLGIISILFAKTLFTSSIRTKAVPMFLLSISSFRYRGFYLVFTSAVTALTTILKRGLPTEYLSSCWLWMIIPLWIVLSMFFGQGLLILKKAFHNSGIFYREGMSKQFRDILQKRSFSNCKGPLLACVSENASYVNPFDQVSDPPERYSRSLSQSVDVHWRDGPPKIEWVPRYVDIKEEENAEWLLEATSALPYIFKAVEVKGKTVFDPSRYFVDGGLVDNCPVAPVLFHKPDVVIVVEVNHASTYRSSPETEDLKTKVEESWQKSFFSDGKNYAESDQMRKRWLDEPGTQERELRQFFSGRIDRFMGWNQQVIVANTPRLTPDLEGIDFIFIRPSVNVSCPIPGLDQLTGTVRFDQKYVDWLEKLGYEDARGMFE